MHDVHKNLQTQQNETETRRNEGGGNETRLCHDVGATPPKNSRIF